MESAEAMRIIRIDDLSIPALDIFGRLSEVQLKRYYEPNGGLFIAETPMIIERALDFGCEPVAFLVEDTKLETEAVQRLLEKSVATAARLPEKSAAAVSRLPEGRTQLPVYTAPLSALTALIGFELTRGVLCALRRPEERNAQEILALSRRVAVLENVMNPTNLGAIFRSAAALGIDAVLLTRGCTDPLYRRAARVAMGTVFQVPWAFLETEDYIGMLRACGFTTAAMALCEKTVSIADPRLKQTERLAVVLGTEGEGLAKETIDACDFAVKIPMAEGVDSLNVAAASAVAFWELRKREA